MIPVNGAIRLYIPIWRDSYCTLKKSRHFYALFFTFQYGEIHTKIKDITIYDLVELYIPI